MPEPEPGPARPLAYLITFSSRGSHLHGDARGSVDRGHNSFGTEFVVPNRTREAQARKVGGAAVEFDIRQRRVIDRAIPEVCAYRGWALHTRNVRTQHVHVVVSGDSEPDPMMEDFKAYATRAMNNAGLWTRGQKPWTRHGSTRYLWTAESVENAIVYVRDRQGPSLI